MFLERVSKIDRPALLLCPNQCGSLTILKRRQAILYMVPMELIENLENCSEEMYGYIAGVCPECGFILITDNKEEGTQLGKCRECGLPATHPSGLCRDCFQSNLEAED